MKIISKLNVLAVCLLTLFVLSGCTDLSKSKFEPNQSGYVQVENGKLFYQKFGSGTPVIVLHGGPGLDQSYLLPQMLELAKDHEVIFYDQRGSGNSLETPMDSTRINIDQFTEDLEKLRYNLGLNKFILIGHSWGGLLAMNYSVTHPERVSSLVLLNTAPADYRGQQAFMGEFAKRTQPINSEITPLFKHEGLEKLKKAEISELYRKLFSVYFYDPKDVAKLTLDMNEISAKSGAKVMEEMSKTSWLKPNNNLFPRLKNLKIPTLIVHGNQDLIPSWTAEEIKETIANAEIVYLDQCGHFPYIEKPEQLFSKIKQFLLRNPY